MQTNSMTHQREKGALVYSVVSRRSGGLSLGLNLFPDRKNCSFNCPYCEVFPFSSGIRFSEEQMEKELLEAIRYAKIQNLPVKNVCFSGNGEPTLSPDFPGALKRAGRIRNEMNGSSELVLITNGSFLLEETLISLLRDAVFSLDLKVWLKLDAGTQAWYTKMNRSNIPFEKIIGKMKEFAASAPFIIQTMVCAFEGEGPPPEEVEAWEQLVVELASIAANSSEGKLRRVQIYGKARLSPEDPKTTALPIKRLEERAASLRQALSASNADSVLVEVYP
jgi:histidinol dehydrogenase